MRWCLPLAVSLLGVALAAAACGGGTEPPSPAGGAAESSWPTKGWTTSTPETEGLDPAVLTALHDEFAAGQHGYIDSMLVIRHGRLVFERSYTHDYKALFSRQPDQARGPYNYYDPDWHPYRDGDLHTMQSVSKSVTSALIGIAIGQGRIPGVQAKVAPYFADFQVKGDRARWDAMTLEHVLTMTTGIQWDESTVAYTDPRNSCAGMEKSDDWIQFVLDQSMATDPGGTFVYNSGATELLSYLIKKTTGREAHEYAREHLFAPLGIDRFYWKTTPRGLADTEGGLYLTPHDLAKFAYLYLRDGIWEGRRILPEGWVAASTRPLVDTGINTPKNRKYGYQWWLLPHGEGRHAYVANGYGGQYAIVVPEHDLIAVFTGWNIYDKPALPPQLALERILAALKG
ncbi:MAG: serine hydrolase [Acidobacteria bacterium]|nr:serine hydrolase [Acidobacteriota bacterium]